MVVFGTRPEAIKMAPVVSFLRSYPSEFVVSVCVTAQHREMLDQVLNLFELSPDMDLDLMRKDQSLTNLTSLVMIKIKDAIDLVKPNLILVHGDTTTSMATALVAFYSGVKVAHVEAGLRTHNLYSPFPEEFNRQIVSKLAKWHFAPTVNSKNNLVAEGVLPDRICVTGNTVIDALHFILGRIDSSQDRLSLVHKIFHKLLPFDIQLERFVLITGHRRENFGEGLKNICEAIKTLAVENSSVKFVYPVHLNPNVKEIVNKSLKGLQNVFLIDPLDYEPFVYLMSKSYLVLTDSGGIQEEAPSLGKPVLLMRDVTERPEVIEAGTVRLVGSNKEKIVSGVSTLLKDDIYYQTMSKAHNPYGDGNACKHIFEFLKKRNF